MRCSSFSSRFALRSKTPVEFDSVATVCPSTSTRVLALHPVSYQTIEVRVPTAEMSSKKKLTFTSLGSSRRTMIFPCPGKRPSM